MNKPVIQEWTWALPLMQQTVLLTAVRGPDGIGKYHKCKYLIRWLRRCVLLQALDGVVAATPYEFGGGSFTGPSYEPTTLEHDWRPKMDAIFSDYLRSLDELPHHFQLHFMHAAEIIGYKHPDEMIRGWWQTVYFELANDMHLTPETIDELDYRLCDNEEQWRARNHEATQS
jgi:hypothetical protein